MQKHTPVFLKEVLEIAGLTSGQHVIDGTLGGGGHAKRFLEETGPTGRLLAFELDDAAYDEASKNLAEYQSRIMIVRENFSEIEESYKAQSFIEHVDLVFLDLGLSSFLIDQPHKGISFQSDGPLDMRFHAKPNDFMPPHIKDGKMALEELRMRRGQDLTAADIVNGLREADLADLLYENGESRGRSVARKIVSARKRKMLVRTTDLLEIFPRASGRRRHPATQTFQALRIVVNGELESLQQGLEGAWNILSKNGKIIVLSYHSLEDRIVKQFFKSCTGEILTKKPLVPTRQEMQSNPRSRSAKLRAIQK